MSPIAVLNGGNLLRLRHRPLILEFRPEPADALGACTRVQAKTIAQELMLPFTGQLPGPHFLSAHSINFNLNCFMEGATRLFKGEVPGGWVRPESEG